MWQFRQVRASNPLRRPQRGQRLRTREGTVTAVRNSMMPTMTNKYRFDGTPTFSATASVPRGVNPCRPAKSERRPVCVEGAQGAAAYRERPDCRRPVLRSDYTADSRSAQAKVSTVSPCKRAEKPGFSLNFVSRGPDEY